MTPLDIISSAPDSEALLLSSVEHTDTGTAVLDHDGFAVLRSIVRAKRNIAIIAESYGPLFTIKLAGPQHASSMVVHPMTCGRRFLNLIYERVTDIGSKYPGHRFPAELTLFAKAIQRFNLDGLVKADLIGDGAVNVCGLLNQAVDHLRHTAQNLSALKRKHTKASLKNQNGGFRWIDRIRSKHGRLCVIRVDLHMDKQYEWGAPNMHAISLKEAFSLRAEFIQKLPGIFKSPPLGYMIKTEFTLRRSVHHHVLLILDGNEHWQHDKVAKMVGEFWKSTITHGRGTYQNVNKHTDMDSADCGIGEVKANDIQKVHALKTKVIAYLCKPDYLARLVIPRRHRLFLKSIATPLIGPKRGRPRKSTQPPDAPFDSMQSGHNALPTAQPTLEVTK